MGKWTGKYVIGLTGNIGTGKSVVRRMLEHLGAYSIDADTLSHRAISRGAPGYQAVVDAFGNWVLDAEGQIDRSRLGKLVFSHPEALAQLEKIVHPLVLQAVDFLVKRVPQKVIVIEAIKLLESGMARDCDSVWVVTVPYDVQVERLVQHRKMSRDAAVQRIRAQSPQEEKISRANVVIRNASSFQDTWQQVSVAWGKAVPVGPESSTVSLASLRGGNETLVVRRGRPGHAAEIASFCNQVNGTAHVSEDDIMAQFGDKAYLLLRKGEQLVGVMGWQVENLVACAMDILFAGSVSAVEALPLLVKEMERSSREHQCEAAVVFAPEHYVKLDELWNNLGYIRRELKELEVQAWQEAARENKQAGTVLYFKQLREDRILRPI